DVAPHLRTRRDRTRFTRAIGLDPRQRSNFGERCRHVEPQRVWLAALHAPPAFGLRKRTRIAGIERRAVRVARPRRMPLPLSDKACDLAAGLEAGIDKAIEPRQCSAVVVEMRALAPHRLLPLDAEPRQVFIDRLLVFPTAARHVDVLDAQQEAA